MSINIGIRAHDVSEHTFKHLFSVTANYGFNNVQFAPFKFLPKELIANSSRYSPGLLNDIDQKFRHAGVRISVLGNYVNMIDYENSIRNKNLQSYYDSLVAERFLHAAVVGSETGSILSPNGYSPHNFTNTALLRVIDSVKQITKTAEKLGALFAIEPGINHPLYDNYAVRRVLDAVNSPNLFVIFDLANLISKNNYKDQDTILTEAARLYGSRICTFHLKDVDFMDGKKVTVPFGSGIIDVERYIDFINKLKPYTFATFEATKENDLDNAISVFRKADKQATTRIKALQ
ncbi:sugar phosphate isomerase/epimerase [Limosilactobacillus sp. STM2_1]|uniref:Sugar phosphate isomerase/epimerase n=1 Tax=Limosilactobacillus rudii TaxID=2759755 RepID=A0A7W3UKR0_9LACO|nr:sugar phosphate isomerase/epimerase [Limosilactobacillus rudii]MBB1078692.1 sugar phosphate isomerase/epimerase [Limosilactobacillus rudii]MBB1096740.1 sugar phosphate isomerase/epimerase [Limosilactobacillus rudii]MCD7135588.1 sugar phosphate isomerase/epimerase [Limosilactobacillus rudii]